MGRVRLFVLVFFAFVNYSKGMAFAQGTPQQTVPGQINQLSQNLSSLNNTLKNLTLSFDQTKKQLDSLQAQTQQLNEKITSDESIITKVQNVKGVTPDQAMYLSKIDEREKNFDSSIKRLVDTQGDIAKSQLDMSRTLWALLPAIFGVLALTIAAGSFILKWWADNRMKYANERIDEYLRAEHEKLTAESNRKSSDLESKITKQLRDEHYILLGDACAQLAVPWWEAYEGEYQSFLKKELVSSDTFIGHIRGAKLLTERGKAALDQLGKENIHKNNQSFLVYAKLQNHWVYHATAHVICRRENSTIVEKTRISEAAFECLQLSNDRRVLQLWWELKQTAAFALIQLADGESRRKGVDEMRALLEGHSPGPEFPRAPTDWLAQMWEECFPRDKDGNRTDLFQLGQVASPVAS